MDSEYLEKWFLWHLKCGDRSHRTPINVWSVGNTYEYFEKCSFFCSQRGVHWHFVQYIFPSHNYLPFCWIICGITAIFYEVLRTEFSIKASNRSKKNSNEKNILPVYSLLKWVDGETRVSSRLTAFCIKGMYASAIHRNILRINLSRPPSSTSRSIVRIQNNGFDAFVIMENLFVGL